MATSDEGTGSSVREQSPISGDRDDRPPSPFGTLSSNPRCTAISEAITVGGLARIGVSSAPDKVGQSESSRVERVGMTHRWKFVLVAAVIAPGLMACESSTSGSPTSVSAVPVELFDPCTGIPDDALQSAGVDPASEERGIAGVDQSGWKICTWKGARYYITVFSTGRTVSEFEQKPGNVDFRDVTIAGRNGREFRVAGASKELGCDVLLPAQQGVLQLRITNKASSGNPEDPCSVINRVGDSVIPVLPN
ncbi:DUF3558 domain-containing protein [Nocardia noduli]|uniref:DUF3558 domain-containing protein n=1 Tax=Nocardia noduli TaxID=2815722 RepID=UPI0027E21023|nr:DUF3558 domain-containing protein [Nocardia noduli]